MPKAASKTEKSTALKRGKNEVDVWGEDGGLFWAGGWAGGDSSTHLFAEAGDLPQLGWGFKRKKARVGNRDVRQSKKGGGYRGQWQRITSTAIVKRGPGD